MSAILSRINSSRLRDAYLRQWTIVCSANGWLSVRQQAIIWANAKLLFIDTKKWSFDLTKCIYKCRLHTAGHFFQAQIRWPNTQKENNNLSDVVSKPYKWQGSKHMVREDSRLCQIESRCGFKHGERGNMQNISYESSCKSKHFQNLCWWIPPLNIRV